MTPHRTVVGSLASSRLFNRPLTARLVVAALVAVLLFFGFFPERHRAAVTLTPSDPTSMGLSGALGQLGAINGVFGNQAAVEVALKVGRSIYVREIVARQLDLKKRLSFKNDVAMHRWLEREVDVRSLRGGIILIEMQIKDRDLARDIVAAYAAATRERLGQISRAQTEYKRDVVLKLLGDASARLAAARTAYDTFRLQNRFGDPEMSLGAISSQIPTLEAAIRAKQVEITAARQFYTEGNIQLRQRIAELQALRSQLASAKATNPAQSNSVGRAVVASSRAQMLQRDVAIAQTLYDGYRRFLESTTAEGLASGANVRILEPAYVDTDRQINYLPVALALALALLWAAAEFYRLRPPAGNRVVVREEYA